MHWVDGMVGFGGDRKLYARVSAPNTGCEAECVCTQMTQPQEQEWSHGNGNGNG
jgi:hypothetical protein